MNFVGESEIARKKLEKYSYQLNSHIGKGYSSQVFKGRNDITSTHLFYHIIIKMNQSL
jgi:hypothetical protein